MRFASFGDEVEDVVEELPDAPPVQRGYRQRVAQTQILDGSGGSAAATVAWLHDYFGGIVTTVAAPASGPSVTVLLGSDFTLKTFPAPTR